MERWDPLRVPWLGDSSAKKVTLIQTAEKRARATARGASTIHERCSWKLTSSRIMESVCVYEVAQSCKRPGGASLHPIWIQASMSTTSYNRSSAKPLYATRYHARTP